MIFAIRNVVRGVVFAGFATTTFPVIKAGPSLLPSNVVGKFHGTIAPMTPSGRRTMRPYVSVSRSGT
jgi:hypothetical protein